MKRFSNRLNLMHFPQELSPSQLREAHLQTVTRERE